METRTWPEWSNQRPMAQVLEELSFGQATHITPIITPSQLVHWLVTTGKYPKHAQQNARKEETNYEATLVPSRQTTPKAIEPSNVSLIQHLNKSLDNSSTL